MRFSSDINSGGEHSYLPRFIDKGVETQKIQELPQRDTIQKENITLEPEALWETILGFFCCEFLGCSGSQRCLGLHFPFFLLPINKTKNKVLNVLHVLGVLQWKSTIQNTTGLSSRNLLELGWKANINVLSQQCKWNDKSSRMQLKVHTNYVNKKKSLCLGFISGCH